VVSSCASPVAPIGGDWRMEAAVGIGSGEQFFGPCGSAREEKVRGRAVGQGEQDREKGEARGGRLLRVRARISNSNGGKDTELQ
jgi:hypothetical protein